MVHLKTESSFNNPSTVTYSILSGVNSKPKKLKPSITVGITDYQVLIGDFVNEVKREVEDAWDWTSLRTLITVPTVANT